MQSYVSNAEQCLLSKGFINNSKYIFYNHFYVLNILDSNYTALFKFYKACMSFWLRY